MSKPTRLQSIDLLRGFVIVLMALDHVRDFFGAAPFQPEDLAATSPGWFWTRWITHLCAPMFVLLAGSSAWLRGQRSSPGNGTAALSRYLASRGLMLILLEITWVNFSWEFNFDVVTVQVIWAIGVGMLTLAALVWLPRPAIPRRCPADPAPQPARRFSQQLFFVETLARAGLYSPERDIRRLRDVSPDAMDRPDRGRLPAGPRVHLAGGAPPALAVARQRGTAAGLHRPARLQHLRRSRSLEHAGARPRVRPDVLHACAQVPAFAAVSVHHGRNRPGPAGRL